MFLLLDRITLLALRLRLAHETAVFEERKRSGVVRMEHLLKLGHVSGDLIKFRRYIDARKLSKRSR